jgi:hypothetical protein
MPWDATPPGQGGLGGGLPGGGGGVGVGVGVGLGVGAGGGGAGGGSMTTVPLSYRCNRELQTEVIPLVRGVLAHILKLDGLL